MDKVYLIVLSSGDRDDYTEHIHSAHSSREKAEEKKEEINARLKTAGLDFKSMRDFCVANPNLDKQINHWMQLRTKAPEFQWVDWTGADIEIREVLFGG